MVLGALALRPGGSGVQTYARELTRALAVATRAELEAVVQSDAVQELPSGVRPRVRPRSDGVRRALLGLLPVHGADLLHSLDVDQPLGQRCATVSTVHDTAVFDAPWAFSRHRAAGERLLLRRSLRRADAVLSVSAFTAERVRTLFGRESIVTPLAPAPAFRPPDSADVERVRETHRLPAEFVLHVGTVEPRKQVDLLARCCASLRVPLVLAGAVPGGVVVPATARHLGYVPTADLPGLYASATIVAYPSRYEGFGLPPLEAMACGAAVVATRVGALPETLGEAAALIPPGDEAALSAALRTVLCDHEQRSQLRHDGLLRAESFRWKDTAARTLAVYRRLGVAA